MEIPIFSLIVFFLLGFIFLKQIKNLKAISTEEKIILSLCFGISLCMFLALAFLAIQRFFAY
ncbi:MAG: hypothetical protein A3B90_03240 [Candidatus Magasanikbacteria bacterium RIFCSPHIGHO2_02_FULL_41_13]|uniref:Uncharacterized protein n=1 Tax=Candidatus Magasanikbacteria bacterium RIFCSPHIGHO2_02_FULL_41_13 TaxID=1798676 RepID=A0A1F6M619_9BACT|nr:MAG: hypothetical protein A3B90_03240 [Candidatus Magasanikbacteria bacterium RIFCSPHIGHO2_02_FULL_41_13]